ncbi:hypothetical protein YPPY52_3292, partial [Yersinia pestis PY-52]
MATLTALR